MCLELVPQVVYNMEKLKVYSLDKHVKKHVKNLTTRNKLLNGIFKAGPEDFWLKICRIKFLGFAVSDFSYGPIKANARYASCSSYNIFGANCSF